ncbi:hypothetical protein VS868_11810 [Salinimicrobium sp. 3283s]|uniref:hypothetical protein n=1 Tax=Salinimicrobium sp. 3283s TaxID=3114359 RepID=UPI0031EFDA94
MDTKVNKLTQLYKMQSHKAERIVELIENHIPRLYTDVIIERCKKNGIIVSDNVVKDVKLFRTKNVRVLNVILEFARENRKAQRKLEQLATGN